MMKKIIIFCFLICAGQGLIASHRATNIIPDDLSRIDFKEAFKRAFSEAVKNGLLEVNAHRVARTNALIAPIRSLWSNKIPIGLITLIVIPSLIGVARIRTLLDMKIATSIYQITGKHSPLLHYTVARTMLKLIPSIASSVYHYAKKTPQTWTVKQHAQTITAGLFMFICEKIFFKQHSVKSITTCTCIDYARQILFNSLSNQRVKAYWRQYITILYTANKTYTDAYAELIKKFSHLEPKINVDGDSFCE